MGSSNECKYGMTNAFTSNVLVWDVKNDATDFILPNLKFTFLVMLFIWLDHCIFSSKITQRYLASFLRSSGVPMYLTVLLWSFFRRDLFPKKIYITSVFLVFTAILLILSHWSTLRSSLSRLQIKLSGSDALFNMIVSSAYKWQYEFWMTDFMSLMYKRKRRGPSTEPWGTL